MLRRAFLCCADCAVLSCACHSALLVMLFVLATYNQPSRAYEAGCDTPTRHNAADETQFSVLHLAAFATSSRPTVCGQLSFCVQGWFETDDGDWRLLSHCFGSGERSEYNLVQASATCPGTCAYMLNTVYLWKQSLQPMPAFNPCSQHVQTATFFLLLG